MNRIRVSLSQRQSEIVGKVELEGDAAFMLESLAATVEALAKRFEVEPAQLVRDLYSVVCGKVKK